MLSFLKNRVHVSWLIAVLFGAFVAGVWTASFVMIDVALAYFLLVVGLIFALLAFKFGNVISVTIIVAAGLSIGFWRGSIIVNDLAAYRQFYDSVVMVDGRVRDDPVIGDGNALVVQIDGVVIGGSGLPGVIWLTTSTGPDIKRGDQVSFKGKLAKGFGTFPAVMYRASLLGASRSPASDPAGRVRDWFSNAVRSVIPEPGASLGMGYLTGQKSALPSDLADSLQVVGLTHIVVASGYNLTILVRLSRRLFMRISKYTATLSSFLMIASFVMVTGFSPSMSRAGLVASLSLIAWYYGHRFHPFVLIPFAAGVTVAIEPSYAWGDMGWQLSFAAFAGVIIIAPLIQRFFFGERKPGILRQVLGETVAAHFATPPIIIAGFGVVSNVAVFANLLVVPLVPLAMLLTFLSGIFALLAPSVAYVVAAPTDWLLAYMINVAEYMAELSWAQTQVSFGWIGILIYYAVLFAVCFLMWHRTKYDLREANIVE